MVTANSSKTQAKLLQLDQKIMELQVLIAKAKVEQDVLLKQLKQKM
jgi:hypothetical protein